MFLIGLLLCQTKIQFAREQGILVLLIFAVIAALAVGFSFDFFFLSFLSLFFFFLLYRLLQGHISREKAILVVPAHIFDFSGQNLFPRMVLDTH